MFDNIIVRVGKAVIWFSFLVIVAMAFVALLGAVSGPYWFLHEAGITVSARTLALWYIFCVTIYFATVVGFSMSSSLTGKRLDEWQKKRALRRLPLLHVCRNNGVIAVVTEAQSELSPCEWIVAGAMSFSDSSNPEVRKRVTGTLADFRRLTYGARIVEHFGLGHLYVPYTSGMMERAEEDALFPHVSLQEAERRIWQGYKRPKTVY